MIVGLGTDIVDIGRVRAAIERHGGRFIAKVFTDGEQAEAAARAAATEYYAGRWAVKEAVAKALGCGIGVGCGWLDAATNNDPASGRPRLELAGAAASTAAALGAARWHVSISHDAERAVAIVILES